MKTRFPAKMAWLRFLALLWFPVTAPAQLRDKESPVSCPEATFALPFRLGADELKLKVTAGAGFSDYQFYPDSDRSKEISDQNYGDYIHAGVDFRVAAGTPVYTIRPGKILEAFNHQLKWHSSVKLQEVGDDGGEINRYWDYIHLDPNKIPPGLLAMVGQEIPEGTLIGYVVPWIENEPGIPDQIDIADGKRYDHLHVDIYSLDANQAKVYHNPARVLSLPNHAAPRIEAIYLVDPASGNAYQGPTPVISGRVSVVTEAYHHMGSWHLNRAGGVMETLGGSPFRLGVYEASVEVIAQESGHVCFQTQLPPFDRIMQSGRSLVGDVYLRQIIVNNQPLRARGDRFGRRSFLAVTQMLNGRPNKLGSWDTTSCDNGLHTVRVRVANEAGHWTSRDIKVQVANQTS